MCELPQICQHTICISTLLAVVTVSVLRLCRDSCVSYLRGEGNASERELEALAIYMGNLYMLDLYSVYISLAALLPSPWISRKTTSRRSSFDSLSKSYSHTTGHSVAMQRDSYDRRTLKQKVHCMILLLWLLSRRAGLCASFQCGSSLLALSGAPAAWYHASSLRMSIE